MCRFPRFRTVVGFALLTAAAPAPAQSTKWDKFMSDSIWYCPPQNFLAMETAGTNFLKPERILDETVWFIGDCTNGRFSGRSVANLDVAGQVQTSTLQMTGVILDSGRYRIQFSAPGAPTTIGIGRVLPDSEGTLFLQAQMFTGTGGANGYYVTHWANSPRRGEVIFVDKTPSVNRWIQRTNWTLSSAELFGRRGVGQFRIRHYEQGFFWGVGQGPFGSSTPRFTLIGSVTPNGHVLFNTVSRGKVHSFAGDLYGSRRRAHMILRQYEQPFDLKDAGEPSKARLVRR